MKYAIFFLLWITLSTEASERLITEECLRQGVEQKYVKYVVAIAHVESGMRANPVVPKSMGPSVGIMQITPSTARLHCPDVIRSFRDLRSPSLNIRCGVRIFSTYLNRYDSVRLAIASYNAGSPRYCRKTRYIYTRYGRCMRCVKGMLVNYQYVKKVMKRASYI